MLPPLSDLQHRQLSDFVTTVLPPEGGRIWNRNNELEYVHSVVNRWMKKLFGFHISPADLFTIFETGNYLIHRVSLEECPEELSAEVDHKAFEPYSEYGAWRLHINVHVLSLRLLSEFNRPLPANVPMVKRVAQTRLTERIALVEQRSSPPQAA
ncbi:MAG TPA: hypothetical protein PK760_00550 [Flavobacteriales bacterium]|nr:hypothetical protein [Flavobacteriales bacterium]